MIDIFIALINSDILNNNFNALAITRLYKKVIFTLDNFSDYLLFDFIQISIYTNRQILYYIETDAFLNIIMN
jgi:hypothetical protein